LRDFRTASAAPVIAAAAAKPTPTFFAALFTFAIFRLRCCFLTMALTALVAERVIDFAPFLASLATLVAFFVALRNLEVIRSSGGFLLKSVVSSM
jgi:hypothetical protein